jgi:hypothetical protein
LFSLCPQRFAEWLHKLPAREESGVFEWSAAKCGDEVHALELPGTNRCAPALLKIFDGLIYLDLA